LKKTIESLKNSISNNINSSFRATGILPFDKLPNLPEEDELSEDLEASKWTDTFVKILSDLRNLKQKVVMKLKGKNLNVPATLIQVTLIK
jgi:hypothetical protein